MRPSIPGCRSSCRGEVSVPRLAFCHHRLHSKPSMSPFPGQHSDYDDGGSFRVSCSITQYALTRLSA